MQVVLKQREKLTQQRMTQTVLQDDTQTLEGGRERNGQMRRISTNMCIEIIYMYMYMYMYSVHDSGY